MKEPPRILDSDDQRKRARASRDGQWAFMERVARLGTVWFCWWNKNRRHDTSKPLPEDLLVTGLIDGVELLDWMKRHDEWWVIGEWSDQQYAAPVSLTEAGRAALAERGKYDMEPVFGGLADPGWQCTPTPTEDHL